MASGSGSRSIYCVVIMGRERVQGGGGRGWLDFWTSSAAVVVTLHRVNFWLPMLYSVLCTVPYRNHA